ncbi:MAG: TetR/AcrR family transcriptional regulator [Clostridiales bacterium]|nr:TetR/AcrR family transcriptional regulator [Clostridiales bacterium]
MSLTVTSEDRFADALLTLLKKTPYEAISVSVLCRQAGLSRQTFYKFFNSKESLLNYIAQGLNLKYLAHRDYSQKDGFFTFWLEQRDIAEVLIDRGLMHRVACVNPQTIDILHSLLQWKDIEGGDSLERLLYEFVNAGEIRLLECWRADGWKQSPGELADVVELAILGNSRMEALTEELRGKLGDRTDLGQ